VWGRSRIEINSISLKIDSRLFGVIILKEIAKKEKIREIIAKSKVLK
jgi:hypothetical protein